MVKYILRWKICLEYTCDVCFIFTRLGFLAVHLTLYFYKLCIKEIYIYIHYIALMLGHLR